MEFFCRTLWILKGIGDGDCVSAIAQQAQLASTWSAFALWCSGGDRVVTWGTWAKIQAKGCGGGWDAYYTFHWWGSRFPFLMGCHPLQNWNEKTSGQDSKKSTRLKKKNQPFAGQKWVYVRRSFKKSQTFFLKPITVPGVNALPHFFLLAESSGGKSWPVWCQQCNFYAKVRQVDLHFIFNVLCIYVLHASVYFFKQFSMCDAWCFRFFCI